MPHRCCLGCHTSITLCHGSCRKQTEHVLGYVTSHDRAASRPKLKLSTSHEQRSLHLQVTTKLTQGYTLLAAATCGLASVDPSNSGDMPPAWRRGTQHPACSTPQGPSILPCLRNKIGYGAEMLVLQLGYAVPGYAMPKCEMIARSRHATLLSCSMTYAFCT